MMDQDEEDDGSGYRRAVEAAVTLEMLTDQELVDELVSRQRLCIIRAVRSFPLDRVGKEGLGEAMNKKLAYDLADFMVQTMVIAFDEIHNPSTGNMEYEARTIVLATLAEERPL